MQPASGFSVPGENSGRLIAIKNIFTEAMLLYQLDENLTVQPILGQRVGPNWVSLAAQTPSVLSN